MLWQSIRFLIMVGLSSCGVSTPPIELRPCAQFFYGDVPLSQNQNTTFLCHSGYATLHDNLLKVPSYSAEKLEAANLNGTVTRSDDFRPDPMLNPNTRAELADYRLSGFDRGHMAPAGDFSTDPVWMSESFLLSNMVPQDRSMNAGIWSRLETATRNCALNLGVVFVVTGTIFENQNTTIGIGKVGVPTHLFKIILDPQTGDSRAYVMANTAITGTFTAWQVSVDEVEARAGLDFFPNASVSEFGLGSLCALNFP